MVMTSIHCPAAGAEVTLVRDFEGSVTQVICPEYDGSQGTCRLKAQVWEGGPLARLLERTSEHGLDSRSTLCHLRAG